MGIKTTYYIVLLNSNKFGNDFINQVNESELERTLSEAHHKRTSMTYHVAETRVQQLQKELKRSIAKSRYQEIFLMLFFYSRYHLFYFYIFVLFNNLLVLLLFFFKTKTQNEFIHLFYLFYFVVDYFVLFIFSLKMLLQWHETNMNLNTCSNFITLFSKLLFLFHLFLIFNSLILSL